MSQPDEHSPARLPGDLLGSRVGRYRLSQRIGEGGMGVVYLGLDEQQRAVAVKVLRPHVAGDPDARLRLRREVDTLQRVRHERIARVLDADVDGPLPFVVTEYVPAVSLDALVRDTGALPTDRLIRLGFGLGDALGAIHGAGVIHRDLKPANVMMSDGGDPVVIDFGIAHIADDSRLTMTGLVMGTPGYLSPELIEGGSVDRATDWWGWAATIAFAATARPPFGRGPMEIVLDRVRRGEADLEGVPEPLAGVLRSALSPDPARRPRPGELRAALTAARQSVREAPTTIVATAPAAVAVGVGTAGSRPGHRAPDAPTAVVPATVLNRRGVSPGAGAPTRAAAPAASQAAPLSAGRPDAAPAPRATGAPATQVSAVPATQVSAVPATQVSAVPATQVSAVPATQVAGTVHTRAERAPAVTPTPAHRGTPGAHASAPSPAAAANLPVGRVRPVGEPTRSYAHDALTRQPPPLAQAHPAQPVGAPPRHHAPPPAPPRHPQPTRQAPPVAEHGPPAPVAPAMSPPRQEVATRQPAPPLQQPGPEGAQPPGQQPAKPARTGTIFAGFLLLIAGFLAAPVITMVALVVVSALARTIDRISWSVLKRRHTRGRRVSDIFYGIAQSPLQLVAGSFWAVISALLPLLLAVCGYFAVWAVLPPDGAGIDELAAPAAAGLVFGLTHWWGPGGRSMRRGSRALARSLTPGRPGSAFAVCLLLILTVAVLTIRWHAGEVNWYPLSVDPLTQIVGVTPSDLLYGSG